MTEHGKKRGFEALDQQLGGLLGLLGTSLSDLIGKLEQGEAGEVNRQHEFQTPQGPVRAETGIRIRMGGMQAATMPRPMNAGAKPAPAKPAPAQPDAGPQTVGAAQVRTPEITTYEAGGRFHLSAELPGVSLSDVVLRNDGDGLILETTGARLFRARIDLPPHADPADMECAMRHGILAASVALAGQGDA